MLTFGEYIREGLLAGPGKSAPKTDPKKLAKYNDSLSTVYTSSTKDVLDKAKAGMGLRAPGSKVVDRHGNTHFINSASTGTTTQDRESVYFASGVRGKLYTRRYGIRRATRDVDSEMPHEMQAAIAKNPYKKGDAGVPATATVRIPSKLLKPDEHHPDIPRIWGGGGRLPDDTYTGIGSIGAVRTKRRGVSARRIVSVEPFDPKEFQK